MKTLQTITNLLAIAIIIAFSSCKKDEEKPSPEIKPIQTYIADSLLKVKKNAGTYELGYTFSSTKKGKITQIGVNMPEPGSYAVRIWDADSKSLLVEKTIEQSVAETKVFVPITPFNIVESKKYVMSVSCDNKAYYSATNATETSIFPFSSQNIVVFESRYNLSSGLGKFPEIVIDIKLYGFPDFVFQEN